MNLKKIATGTIKTAGWGIGAYGLHAIGIGIENIGKEIMKEPTFAIPGALVITIGQVWRIASVVPGVLSGLGAVDVASGVLENKPVDEKDR